MPDNTEQQSGSAETTAATQQTTSTQPTTKKKRKRNTNKRSYTQSQFTIRNPRWSYIHLQHVPTSTTPPAPLDAITVQLELKAALSQFLGLHGAAIAFDVLKIERQDVWIRLPSEDRAALVAAAGGYVRGGGDGWTVKGWNSWDASAMTRDSGQDLFAD